MSIAAKVTSVRLHENGGGELILGPISSNSPPGQPSLAFASGPEEVTALNGRIIWGGDSSLMLGERKIAARIGYTSIEFVQREEFLAAINWNQHTPSPSQTAASAGGGEIA